MIANLLPWDSAFFVFPVGRVSASCEDEPDGEALRIAVLGLDCKLTYVFLPSACAGLELYRSALVALGGRLVDRRMTLRKCLLRESNVEDPEVVVATKITPDLEELAYASGWCSRFAAEERLRPYFRPLYKRWLENDISFGRVFVRSGACGRLMGMTTVSVREGIGRIGLVAVDASYCRQGVATELLQAAERWLQTKGITECRVVTQGLNVGGVALYKKCGYETLSVDEVWHVWR